jgi:hypothetical protein
MKCPIDPAPGDSFATFGPIYRQLWAILERTASCGTFLHVVRPGTGAEISQQGMLGVGIIPNKGNTVSVDRKEDVNIASV